MIFVKNVLNSWEYRVPGSVRLDKIEEIVRMAREEGVPGAAFISMNPDGAGEF